MEEAHIFSYVHIKNDCKNELQSIKMREEGNIFYKKKQLKEALEKYNKCIFSAPHPKLQPENMVTNEYNQLAMGYGNRSAVLYQLKEYERCICDIDRSVNIGISKMTKYQLEERKVKCLIAIERYEEAQELLKKCKLLLNTLQLEEKVKERYKNALYKLFQQCTQGLKKGPIQNKKQKNRYEEIKCANPSTSFSSDDLIFAYNNPRPPNLDDEPNPTIPAFSRALKLQYSPDQGRYVVATRDITPGEVIAVETAYTSRIDPHEFSSPLSFCTFCLARCAAPIPCAECTNVVFCNEECRSKGWDKFHMKECPVYPNLLEFGRGMIDTYRSIARYTIDEFKVFVSQFQKEEHKSPLEQLLNEDQICDSDSYRGFYFLESNINAVSSRRLFDTSVLAFKLIHLLIHSNRFFVTNAGARYVPDEEDIVFIGSLFIRHILIGTNNCWNIDEVLVISNQLDSVNDPVKVGEGTYIALGTFNHSCNPSAMMFSYGNVLVCRATHFIPVESQVFVSYTAPYFSEPDRAKRREKLSDGFAFLCKCDACVYNYKKAKIVHGYIPPSILRTKDKRISRNNSEKTASLKLEL
ncbi:unnamed protein product, partial [Meganyctiphanes norvegica]